MFYHVEVYVRISATLGLIKAWINEDEKINLTGQNTLASANAFVTAISLSNSNFTGTPRAVNTDFDDVVVRNDHQIGDKQVGCYFMNGAGANTDRKSVV